MYSFKNDYSEGAHPSILEALVKTNFEQTVGYGCDEYSDMARILIRKKLVDETIDVHFLVGGTQTNQTMIASVLRPHQAVIAAETGHINVHETGAIEATGHKVLTAKTEDGKLTPAMISEILKKHDNEHMVQPKLVYISNSTELGTIYKKQELSEISDFCKEHSLYLFLDGARLGQALMAQGNDIKLEDISKLTDAFYIGGTKNGALFGEALVIRNNDLKTDFRYHMKQHGGMLAKGRLLGIQFYELLKENLYFELAKHSNDMAKQIKEAILAKGYGMLSDSNTNQLFPIFPKEKIEELSKNFLFEFQEDIDDSNSCIRFVTSWATKEETVQALIHAINES